MKKLHDLYTSKQLQQQKFVVTHFSLQTKKLLIFKSGTRKIYFQYNRVLTPGKFEVELQALRIPNCHVYECDYKWVLDYYQLYGTLLIRHVTTLYNSLLQTYTSHNIIFQHFTINTVALETENKTTKHTLASTVMSPLLVAW